MGGSRTPYNKWVLLLSNKRFPYNRYEGDDMDLKNKHFLKLLDFTPAEIEGLIDLAADLKAKKKAGIPHRMCEGKSIALIFEKTSTRTRCAFEVAAADLGMHPTYLDPTAYLIIFAIKFVYKITAEYNLIAGVPGIVRG